MGGFDDLDKMIAALDPSSIRTAVTGRVVDSVAALASAQYAAGQGPDGAAWPLTRDGEVPLRGLTAQIVFSLDGDRLTARGPDALRYHERTRPVFPPDGEMTEAWATAADEAAQAVLSERLGGF